MNGDSEDNNSKNHPKNKWYDIKPTVRGKAISYFILYVLFVVVDAHDIYPWRHDVAIFSGAIATIALLYAEAFAVGAITSVAWLILSACVAFIAFGLNLYVGPNLPEETTIHGYLIPDKIDTPLINCTSKADEVSLILGTSAFTTDYTGVIPVFKSGECVPLHLQKTHDGLAVDFDMYTPQQDLISRLINNEWRLVPSEFSYQEHPDRSTLQVFDKRGKELFFIKYLNSKVIWLRGVFSCGAQQPVVVDNNSITTQGETFVMGNIVRGTGNGNGKLVIAHGCFESHF
jgi:hypothetical protein